MRPFARFTLGIFHDFSLMAAGVCAYTHDWTAFLLCLCFTVVTNIAKDSP